MNDMEKAALEAVVEELRYQRSAQAVADRAADRARRARADRATGHVPACSLSRCANDCPTRRK